MFKDRAFNLSMLFSVGWHLFWISLIGIVVTPTVQPSNLYQEVDFLGPILEKTAFDFLIEEVSPQAETLYAKSTLFLDKVYLKPKGPERKVLKKPLQNKTSDKFSFILHDYISDTKEIPRYFSEDIRIVYAEKPSKKSLSFVEGPASEREIIFKPTTLTVARNLHDDQERYIVKLRFFVSNNGIVHEIEPAVSSGFPEIDLEAVKFLKKWRFSPVSVVEKDKSVWGITTITVNTK